MLRSNFLFTRCSKFSFIAPNVKRLPALNVPRQLLKRAYATTKSNVGPPMGAARRVVSLPTKVTEMKLRCKVPLVLFDPQVFFFLLTPCFLFLRHRVRSAWCCQNNCGRLFQIRLLSTSFFIAP